MNGSLARASLLPHLLWPTLFTLLVGWILISLGLWQLHRLAWKEGLLAEIAARADAPPVALPPQSEWSALKPQDYDYRHVEATGRYLYADTALVYTPGISQAEGPGYMLLTPLTLASGGTVIVNRGFVPLDLGAKLRDQSAPAGDIRVTGLMQPPQSRTLFTPADAPDKGQFFSRDPAALAAHFHLAPVAPFVIDVDATPGAKAWPLSGTTERSLPNNHLGYALTWFGLALGLAGVYGAFVLRQVKPSVAAPKAPEQFH